jgi:hypothetical protein
MTNNEKGSFSPEKTQQDKEKYREIRQESNERLQEELERRAEKSPKDNPESLKAEALEALAAHEKQAKDTEREPSPAEKRNDRPINNAAKEASFQKTMEEVRSEMSAPSRAFSQLIHNKTVEKISDSVGNTVARPDAILSGAIFAFTLTLGVYLLAKNLGYPLSGFETIGAFAAGWAFGLVFDFLKIMITGRK